MMRQYRAWRLERNVVFGEPTRLPGLGPWLWPTYAIVASTTVALILPRVLGRTETCRFGSADSDEAVLESALNNFHLDCGRYPRTVEGLQALRVAPPDLKAKWRGPYLDHEVPNDPWGDPYVYEKGRNGPDSCTITSYGESGKPGPDAIVVDVGGPPRP